jgi:two-component system response regulator RegA
MMDGKKILIVDDESPYRVFLRKLFERQGCDVETSASGLVSLEFARAAAPDVLIVDWMLRDSMDGLQVAAEMRKLIPGLRTVLITGYPSPDLEQQAAKHPQTTYLAKPFESDEIVAVVLEALMEGG